MNTERTQDPLGEKAGSLFLRTWKEMPKTPDDTEARIAQMQYALRMASAQAATLEQIGRKR
mgnify:CR=1 FL=1